MTEINKVYPRPFDFSVPGEAFKLGIVVSRFNEEITNALLESALRRLQELKFPETCITIVSVPGAVEIGLAAQKLALSKEGYCAIICLGAVIRGETDHYDYVCWQVSYACQKVALEEGIPVIFGVLTTDNEEQALDRIRKGADAVDAALDMVSVLSQLEDQSTSLL